MRILIVEDEPLLARTVAAGLREEAMAVDVAGDGAEALERLAVHDYDVVVLDRDLPGVHGDEVCRQLTRSGATCRILMLTAARSLDDTVAGFGLGADDYLAKPFRFPELVVRIRALCRRGPNGRPVALEAAGVRLDPHRREVVREGREIRLTRKEFGVLELLLAADGGVVSAEQLLEKAWDENADPFTSAVRITIYWLRRKLGDPPLIHTEPGVGYRLADR
ncbi:response regulator transcription factor [Streptacidiphilus carbonis]|uniref:response regulator transcription factor n=1 Tax=Streptacidiphilus carbonis TaxID=105422 RepID=UPI0005A63BBB|nr:response regulator transcription factor [Streptacidiphilus carbonis]